MAGAAEFHRTPAPHHEVPELPKRLIASSRSQPYRQHGKPMQQPRPLQHTPAAMTLAEASNNAAAETTLMNFVFMGFPLKNGYENQARSMSFFGGRQICAIVLDRQE